MLVRSDVLSWAIPLLTIVGLFSAYNAFRYNEGSLSPQGCEMSWMSPSYILQSDFNSTWTPLARRYSLWLYREVGWESDAVLHGSPVLFVPGNAGSSRQVRSIASSAIRQIYDSPYVASDDYKAGKIVPLDFFAGVFALTSSPFDPSDHHFSFAKAEFNEDLSALHGPTLLSQKQYVDAAVDYILSRYSDNPSPPKQVLLLGHSMGGLVAVSVTSSNRISAVITMSSPHALPPARFDRRIEDLYSDVLHALQSPIHANGTTSPPILSLCGGATDSLIPAETCSLPAFAGSVHPYRRTAFTTNLDGAWTGVGHNEMVWCHQVRSRVARTALELAAVKTTQEKEHVLDRWFVAPSASRASQAATSPANGDSLLPSLAQQWSIIDTTTTPMLLIPSTQFTLHTNQPNTNLYLLPLRPGVRMQLVLLLHRSTLMDSAKSVVAGPARSDLSVTLYFCGSSTPSQADNATCSPMTLTGDAVDIQPLPLPDPSKPFPVPHEGSQPDDASVAVTIRDLTHATDGHTWVGVLVSGRAEEGRRGLAAVLEEVPSRKEVGMKETALEASMLAPVLGSLPVDLRRPSPLITDIRIPRMFMNALVVYKAEPHYAAGCDATKASFPLLQHISSPAEKHMHVLDPSSSTLLHTHSRGPF
ncbi:GPI inositol deacylase, partial [Tulasnella sp. 403]